MAYQGRTVPARGLFITPPNSCAMAGSKKVEEQRREPAKQELQRDGVCV